MEDLYTLCLDYKEIKRARKEGYSIVARVSDAREIRVGFIGLKHMPINDIESDINVKKMLFQLGAFVKYYTKDEDFIIA